MRPRLLWFQLRNRSPTNLNPVYQAPNLRFPVPAFFTADLDLWFFQLEATFIVNRVTTEKDKYAVVIANLPYSAVRRILRNLVTETTPYTILKELDISSQHLCINIYIIVRITADIN